VLDVLQAITAGDDATELDEYAAVALTKMKSARDDREICDIVDRGVLPNFDVMQPPMKRALVLVVLSTNAWMQDWVFAPAHPHRRRGAAHAAVREPFLHGLRTLYAAYADSARGGEAVFVHACAKLYGLLWREALRAKRVCK
jgi:hypothetical protein